MQQDEACALGFPVIAELTSSDEFDRTGWTGRLAAALKQLGEAQRPYRTQIDQQRKFLDFTARDVTTWRQSENLSTVLRSFHSQDGIPALRIPLRQVRQILTAHPSLTGVVDPLSVQDELWIQDVNLGGTEYLRGIVSGLMARAEEHSSDGHVAAAHELSMLLEAAAGQFVAGYRDPSLGYHVVLFRGLRLDRAIPVGDEVRIVPLDELEDFVNLQSLGQMMPLALSGNSQDFAAVTKPFRWTPQLVRSRAEATPKLPDAHAFLEDAEDLVELLAVLHESPVVCLAKMLCKNRIASLLLGRFHSVGGFTYGRSGQGFRWRGASPNVNHEVIERACKAFRSRAAKQYKDCAPIIGRLSEALSRGGRFGVNDRIFDVAIALERMYQMDGSEIRYKLGTRAAFFLGRSPHERRQIFDDLRKFYSKRSTMIHGRGNDSDAQSNFGRGFHIARRTLEMLLESGLPSDWDQVVIDGDDMDSQ